MERMEGMERRGWVGGGQRTCPKGIPNVSVITRVKCPVQVSVIPHARIVIPQKVLNGRKAFVCSLLVQQLHVGLLEESVESRQHNFIFVKYAWRKIKDALITPKKPRTDEQKKKKSGLHIKITERPFCLGPFPFSVRRNAFCHPRRAFHLPEKGGFCAKYYFDV